MKELIKNEKVRALIKKAVEEGMEKGQNRLALLVGRLLEAGQMDDLKRVSYDEAYREKLLKEFGL